MSRSPAVEADGYNGWRNWETWVTNLWLTGNDPVTERAARANAGSRDELQAFVEYLVLGDDPVASLGTDYVSGCLSVVDWDSIVEALHEE
jgi:hypothetical protein